VFAGGALELRTPRLRLRPLRDDDRAAIVDMHAHPDVWQVFGDDPADVTAGAQRLVTAFLDADPSQGDAPWAIEPVDHLVDVDGRAAAGIVGLVGLSPTRIHPPFAHRVEPCVEISWRLARPWWGQGIVTEGAATCLAHGRDRLGLPEVVAFTSASNDRSRAVMVRLGMLPDPSADFEHPNLPIGDPRRSHVVYRTNWGPEGI
jgi:RimJ/RimL family protein N-acetyltransferase